MQKADAEESVPLIARVMRELLGVVQSKQGREGSEVRRAVGDLLAHALQLLRADEAGEPIALCYERARQAGVTLVKFMDVLSATVAEHPSTTGATLTRNSLIVFCLSDACRVLADMQFESRLDVDAVRTRLNDAFAEVEEAAADSLDSMTYRTLVTLHAAVMAHLVETARPLPRMMRFHFAQPLPTLVAAYRLYDDASRCDDLRKENQIVHPAFGPKDGLALSA